jgi:MFS family permease
VTRDLRLVALSLILWGIGEGMFIYFQPVYLQRLGADPLQIGGILGLAAASMVLAHIPAGAMADHFGRKKVMVSSWVLGMLAAWLMFLSSSLPTFVAGLVIYTMTAFVASPMSSYITAARGEWTVARALTTVTSGFSAGSVLGPILGGQIAERFGLRPVYGIAGVLFVLSTGLILLIRPQPTVAQGDGHRYQALFANARLGQFLGLIFFMTLAMYLSWPLTPNFLQNERQVGLGELGVFGSLNALGIVVLNLALGRLTPGVGLVLAQVLVGASVVMIWRGSGVAWFGLGYFFAGGFRTARAMITALVERLVGHAEIGLAFGAAETVAAAGMMVAGPLAGWLFDHNPAWPFPVSLVLILLALPLAARFAPRSGLGRQVDEPGIKPAILGRD